MRPRDAQHLLREAYRLDEDYGFWQHTSDGLALFISPGRMEYFKVPMSFIDHCILGKQFYLKPLLRVVSENTQFFVLALSPQMVRLYECTRYDCALRRMQDTPTSLAEANKYEDRERQHHFSPGSQGRRAGTGPVYHGHGSDASDTESSKTVLLRYAQTIADGVHAVLRMDHAPLIVIALENMQSAYREANRYANLASECITMNPEGLGESGIHDLAWQLMQPRLQKEHEHALELYREFVKKGRASSRISEIMTAAEQGRIDTLVVPQDAEMVNGHKRSSRKSGVGTNVITRDNLLDRAAIKTFLTGGRVYIVPASEIPDGKSMAAVFRY
jgi:hypothetical protein